MSAIAEKVKEIIVNKLGVEESQVTPTASFTKDLGADSLDTVELIMEFERAFNITIEDSDAEKIQTVGDAISFLESKVGAES
ncbi:MAG: acyl carrier protein [Chlorobi bacterium NICIL-2]|nr:MAG: acyl carrier protein [Chlorobi bacterium NICIL-2]